MGKPVGRYAKADAEALLRGEALQLMALLEIERQFKVEDDQLKLEEATYDEFMKAWDDAKEHGRDEEFQAQAAQYLMPAIQQVMAQMQAQGQQQGQQ